MLLLLLLLLTLRFNQRVIKELMRTFLLLGEVSQLAMKLFLRDRACTEVKEKPV